MNLKSRRHPVVRRIVTLCVAASAVWCASATQAADQAAVGLITKTDTNPFFVKMRQGAEAAAQKDGAKLLTAAGKFDGDNASQVTAIEKTDLRTIRGEFSRVSFSRFSMR